MVTIAQLDTIGIGLDDEAWKSLSSDVAESLLRVCAFPAVDDRTYTSVQILPTPSGQELYVRSSFSG
ncbi:MAG: hypothetical protein M0Q22_11015 [Sulfuritalea sp.]|jgi:hypothetical protein|nr:hypothetical protein [Sulfuritalea sp.]